MGQGDSRLPFRQRVNELLHRVVPASEHPFWITIFTSNLSLEDVFSLISPTDVRTLRRTQPLNLATIVFKSIEQLYLFTKPAEIASEFTSARTSLRLLTRILPFIFEHDDDGFIQEFFFKNRITQLLDPKLANIASSTSDLNRNGSSSSSSSSSSVDGDADADNNEMAQSPAASASVSASEPADDEDNGFRPVVPGQNAAAGSGDDDDDDDDDNVDEDKDKDVEFQGKGKAVVRTTVVPVTAAFDHDATATASQATETTSAPAATSSSATPTLSPVTVHFADLTGSNPPMPFSQLLISTLMEIMFHPGFCIPLPQVKRYREKVTAGTVKTDDVETDLLWENGIGLAKGNTWTWEQVTNRTEVLNCFLCCFSGVIYQQDLVHYRNDIMSLATSASMKHVATFLYSLLNTICSYDPTGSFPYTSRLVSDPQELLVSSCLHVLHALLDFQWQLKATNDQPQENVYLAQLRSLRKHEDFSFLFNGIQRLLNNRIEANNTYLPGSQKMIQCHEETLILLWRLLEDNPEFRLAVCKTFDVTKLVAPCLYFMQDTRRDQSKFAMIQMCSFILLILSGQREFGVALNKPFNEKLPMELPLFTGNYADLLIIVFHKLIVTDKGMLRPMFECMLTIMCNISPYAKKLCMISSVKLLNLFEAFSAKKFLVANETNYQYVFLLLEILNNLIQYQYEGNIHVVYAILRRHTGFQDLAKLPELPAQPTPGSEHATGSSSSSSSSVPAATSKGQAQPAHQGKFAATPEWVHSWKSRMPIRTILTLIDRVMPEVTKFCEENSASNEDAVLQFLAKTTLVGVLPVPHPILTRQYQKNLQTDIWITTYGWGIIYLKHVNPPFFDATTIKLFMVNVIEH